MERRILRAGILFVLLSAFAWSGYLAVCGKDFSRVTDVTNLLESAESNDAGVILAAEERLVELGASALPELHEALEEEKSVRKRSIVATVLGKIGDPSSVSPLVRALRDPSSVVGQRSAVSLGMIGTDEAVQGLTDALEDPEASGFRTTVLIALGNTRDERALTTILSYVDSPDSDLRWAAATALKSFDEPIAIAALKRLAKDADESVRSRAEDSLRDNQERAGRP